MIRRILIFLLSGVLLTPGFGFRSTIISTRNIKSLPPNKKIYFVDIDCTICLTYKNNYKKSIPNYDKINILNRLYDDGNQIHYWTSRGMLSGKNWDTFTIDQLNSWGVKYDSINMDKPHYDYWIDDKAINIHDFPS